MTSAVVEFGSVWVANLTPFRALQVSSMSLKCVRSYPFHRFEYVDPREPKTLSLSRGE